MRNRICVLCDHSEITGLGSITVLFFFPKAPGMEPKASGMLGKCATTELPLLTVFAGNKGTTSGAICILARPACVRTRHMNENQLWSIQEDKLE
jgi:hypothetical protein